MIERWKDTAFGSDFGMDALDLVESIPGATLDLDAVFARCDLRKFLDSPELLEGRTDNEVVFTGSPYHRFVHYEDLVIALGAIFAESTLDGGAVDLSRALGSKRIHVRSTPQDRVRILEALERIVAHPDRHVLFEMCPGPQGEEVLADIRQMCQVLRESVA